MYVLNGWVYERMSVWTDECINRWVYERMSVWTDECMNAWVYQRMSVSTDESLAGEKFVWIFWLWFFTMTDKNVYDHQQFPILINW